MMEVFKTTGYKNYSVSNLGNVRNDSTGKILKGLKSSNKYLIVTLGSSGSKCIHQLVAFAFIGEKPTDAVIDHIDGNKYNNRSDNLQYLSVRENTAKSKKSSSGFTGVSWNNHAKKWSARILINGKRKSLGYFDSPEVASQAYKNELLTIKF